VYHEKQEQEQKEEERDRSFSMVTLRRKAFATS
jgi:hypothetical protein